MDENEYLTGQLLIAMPQMNDPRFVRSVIYVCSHSADGAMGLVINRTIDSLSFSDLLGQLGVDEGEVDQQIRVHFGGPVEISRGFVLHSSDHVQSGTMTVNDDIALSATIDMIRAIAAGTGPMHSLLALGYAGWGPGQLDGEIQANGWLHVGADIDLVFGPDNQAKWELAMRKLGIDPSFLSSDAGRA